MGNDLAGLRHEELSVRTLQHTTFDFAPYDTLLQQNLVVVFERLLQRRIQILEFLDFADADRRTGAGGFHKDRQPEPLLDVVGGKRLAPSHHQCVGSAQPGGVQENLRDVLVHAVGRGSIVATHVWHAEHLKESLHRSVLAMHSMEHGEGDIERHRLRQPLDMQDRAFGGSPGEADRRSTFQVDFRRIIGIIGEFLFTIVLPDAIAGDARHDRQKALAVNCRHNRAAGLQRDFVFGGLSAAEQQDT